MKLYNRIKNNVEYYKWMKIREEALKEANEHMFDEDQTEYKYWSMRYLYACSKCNSIDIK